MAKTDTKNQEKALAAVLKKAKASYSRQELDALEPIAELVVSFLTWNATSRQADTAFGKIMAQVVDLNELRVSHTNEVIELIGVRYPDAQQRVIRMLQSMMEIFDREHDYKMTSVGARSKREQREYLDSLPGIPPYVAARVALVSFGAHAMPVDDRLLALLVKAGVFDAGTTPAEAESWLTRQVKASDALETYLALEQWADSQRVTIPTPPKTPPVITAPAQEEPVEEPSSSEPAKKVVKKSTRKTTTKKKTTKKRIAKKK